MMKYLIALTVALTIAMTSIATAAEAPIAQPTPIVQTLDVHQGQLIAGNRRKKPSIWKRLMNMERRKNAWLKRTFLGA